MTTCQMRRSEVRILVASLRGTEQTRVIFRGRGTPFILGETGRDWAAGKQEFKRLSRDFVNHPPPSLAHTHTHTHARTHTHSALYFYRCEDCRGHNAPTLKVLRTGQNIFTFLNVYFGTQCLSSTRHTHAHTHYQHILICKLASIYLPVIYFPLSQASIFILDRKHT